MSKPTRHKKHNTEQPVLARSARPTIGLLAANVSMVEVAYPNIVWNGVADAARERDANLICFAGGTLDFTPLGEFQVGSNVLYDLALDNADGLIISSGVLRIYASAEELQGFCDRYRSLPVVSIAVALEGIPSVLVDNVTGLRDAVSHLIEAHGYRRIAFIRGPEGHQEAEARYGAYVEALAAHGLALDPDLVAPGDFSSLSGAAAIHLLLDERKLRPGVDLEAVVASTDRMALGALDELHRRGIQVPYDVAIVGFDDAEEAKVAVPALTTVRQPVYEQAKRATDMVLALLAGDDVPEQVILPTEMVVRQSCGCHSQTVLQAAAEPGTGTEVSQGYSADETFEEALVTRREEILAAMVQAVASYSAETASAKTFEWAGQLLDGFAAAMREGAPASFLSASDQVLRQVAAVSGDPSTGSAAGSPDGSGQSVTAWQGALSALRRHVLPWLSDDEVLSRAENLWQQARLFIAEVAQQIQSYQQLQAERQTGVLQEIGQALITTFDVGELTDVIAQELPRLGIPSSYLSLYEHHPRLAEGGQEMPSQECRLILAYNQDGRIELEPGGRRFAFRELVPDGMLPQERRYAMVVEALYFKNDQLGFALFEAGPRDGTAYEVLQGQISSALQAALLSQQVRRHALQLQTAAEVSSAASGVLDPSELIQQVVDLARERFDLYYAGLFLVDAGSPDSGSVGEPGASPRQQWAVLQAGTGEAGRQMMEQGHKLEVGSGSMIGWCIANRQARIALDVGAEAERFDNPYLPETRSEMALPLISRGEVIGALTVQSAEEAAFSDDDIAALQTMADQLANAITNARLFSETEAALEEAEALAREQAVLNELSQALTTRLDVDRIVEEVYRGASHLLDTAYFFVALYDQDTDEFTLALHAEHGKIYKFLFTRQGATGFSGYIISHRTPLLIRENVIEWAEENGVEITLLQEGHTPLSWVGAPMLVGDRVMGVIAAQSITTPRLYDEHDRDLLTAITKQAAIALQNTYLFDQVQQQLDDLSTIQETTAKFSATLSFDEIVEALLPQLANTVQAGTVSLFLLERDQDHIKRVGSHAAEGLQKPEIGQVMPLADYPLIRKVMDTRQALAFTTDAPQLEPRTRESFEASGITASATIPLVSREGVLGTLVISRHELERAFSRRDMNVLQTFADQAAQTLASSRLFEETQTRAKELTALNEMSRALTAMLDVDAVIESIYTYTSRLLDTTNFYIALYDAQRDEVSFPLYAEGEEIRRSMSRRRTGKGMTEHIIRTREPLLIRADVDAKLEELGIDLIGTPAQSWLGVPMMVAQKVVGVIAVQNYTTPYVYDERDRDLLGAIANQAAQALESARLFEEARTRVEEIAVLNEMSRTLTSILDVDAATESIYEFTARLMDTTDFYVALYNPEAEQVSFPVAIEQGERVQWQPRRLGKGLTEYIIHTGKPLLIMENVNQWLKAHGVQSIGQEAKTWLGAPMLIGEQVIGVVAVQSYTAHLYDEHHRELLSAISSQTAIAIQNARLFQETTSRAEELAVLNELGQALTARLNVDQVLEEAYRQASRLIDTTNFSVGLYDSEKDEIAFHLDVTESEIDREISAMPADQGISGYMMRNRTSLLFEDNVREQQEALGIAMIGQEALSWLGVPMTIGDRTLGVMVLQSFTTPRLYNEHSRDLLTAIASQVAISLQNAQLFEQTQTRAQREAALRQITTIINASDNLVEDLDTIAEALCEFTPADTVSLCSYTPGESEFIYHAVSQGTQRTFDFHTAISLPIRGSSIEWVIINQEPWIVQDLRQERRFTDEDQMAADGIVTRLVMPLRVRDQLIGTLNLGSSQPGVFIEEHVRFVERVADPMALALERARLLQETREALATAEAIHSRYLQQAWESLLSAEPERVWGYTDGQEGMVPNDDIWSPEIERAVTFGELQTIEQPISDDGQKFHSGLAMPIRLRGQIIGVLDFGDENRVWTDEDKALVEELADQVALALENQRLFQQTQRRAYRERLAGEIVGKIRSAGEVQNILETAAQELGRVLGVSRARIRLGGPTDGADQIDEQDNDRQQAIQDE